MKYIIKESQTNLIFESDKLKNVGKLIDKYGLFKTSKKTGIPVKALVEKFPGKINAEEAGIIIQELMFDGELPNEYKEYSVDMDSMSGVVYWNLIDGAKPMEAFSVAATPFWDGDAHIPLDYDYYTADIRFDFESKDVSQESEIECWDFLPFNTYNDVKKWYITKYLPMVYLKITSKLQEIRQHID